MSDSIGSPPPAPPHDHLRNARSTACWCAQPVRDFSLSRNLIRSPSPFFFWSFVSKTLSFSVARQYSRPFDQYETKETVVRHSFTADVAESASTAVRTLSRHSRQFANRVLVGREGTSLLARFFAPSSISSVSDRQERIHTHTRPNRQRSCINIKQGNKQHAACAELTLQWLDGRMYIGKGTLAK